MSADEGSQNQPGGSPLRGGENGSSKLTGPTVLGLPVTRVYLVVIAVLGFALAGSLMYARVKIRRVERQAAAEVDRVTKETAAELERRAQEAARTREQLIASNQKALEAQGGALLRLSALPLSWAIRIQLLKKNYGEVTTYFGQLVREPGVRRALLVMPDGTVKVASDQKLEGAELAELFPSLSLEADAPRVETVADEVLVIVPVMALTHRLGTVIIAHTVSTKS